MVSIRLPAAKTASGRGRERWSSLVAGPLPAQPATTAPAESNTRRAPTRTGANLLTSR
jgi:hypothetical protein